LTSFSDFNYKKDVLAVAHLIVTLQMMSDNRRLSSVIIAHLPTDQVGRKHCSNCKEFEIMAVV
jgi:hypothetical protein